MQQGLPGFDIDEVHNLFFALFPDPRTGAAIVAATETLRDADTVRGRWLKPARHHLTLRFLGTFSRVPDESIARASAAAARVRMSAFDLQLDRFGSFRNGDLPTWLGSSRVPLPLLELHAALGAELAREGVRASGAGSFVPHVTIMRKSSSAIDMPCVPTIDWRVEEFALIDSRVQPPAPFRVLGRWRLGAEDAGTLGEFA